jgi:Caudovirus prohead serine protease
MDKVQYSMPFAKVDVDRRIVAGFATLNNLDRQKDVVTTEASIKAFKGFRGNVRELHNKIAAGKMLSFGVEQYFDTVSKKVYDGIFVRAYISKGSPETWEKVLDGTLNGFSIGGNILDSETVVDDSGDVVRVIKDYELSELSLVDNPANPLANIMSIEKAYDHFSDIANNIDEKEMEKMAETTEGVVGSDVPVESVEAPQESAEPAVSDAPSDTGAVAEEAVTEPPVEVVEVAETDPAKVESKEVASNDVNVLTEALDKLNALIADRDSKTDIIFSQIVEQLKELKGGLDNTSQGVDSVKGELAAVKSTVSEFDKRVDAVEHDTAVRKSGDLGEVDQEEKVEKSIWGGRFLSADLLRQ